MRLSGLERRILWAADLGRVLGNVHESRKAVGDVYRRLDAEGLLAAGWFRDDDLPIQVEPTSAGRTALQLDALR